jgi:hypothetical protein
MKRKHCWRLALLLTLGVIVSAAQGQQPRDRGLTRSAATEQTATPATSPQSLPPQPAQVMLSLTVAEVNWLLAQENDNLRGLGISRRMGMNQFCVLPHAQKVQKALRSLAQSGVLRVVAEPRLVALDGATASFQSSEFKAVFTPVLKQNGQVELTVQVTMQPGDSGMKNRVQAQLTGNMDDGFFLLLTPNMSLANWEAGLGRNYLLLVSTKRVGPAASSPITLRPTFDPVAAAPLPSSQPFASWPLVMSRSAVVPVAVGQGVAGSRALPTYPPPPSPPPMAPPIAAFPPPVIPANPLHLQITLDGQGGLRIHQMGQTLNCQSITLRLGRLSDVNFAPAPQCIQLSGPGWQAMANRIFQTGPQGSLILEGNVRLSCSKPGQQPMVAESQRATINLTTGQMTIEMAVDLTAPAVTPVSNYGNGCFSFYSGMFH